MANYDNIINKIRQTNKLVMVQKTTREEALHQIKTLVDKFSRIEEDCSRTGSHYNETQARVDFISPLFKALGWDVDNIKGLPQDLREVIHEDSVDVGEEKLSKKPDYAFRIARQRKFYVEAKKPCIRIETDKSSAFQIRRYGFSASLPISVLTNFRHLAIYDCVPPAKDTDDARLARIHLYGYRDYVEKFDKIYDSISFESVLSGKFDAKYKVDTAREGTAQFDEYFLAQVRSWRERLAQDLHGNNSGASAAELTFFVQRILNRLIFLRICEDRELEKYDTLLKLGDKNVYAGLKTLLVHADKKYNSGLFDLLNDPTTKLKVSDETLHGIIEELYYPKSPYTFAVVEASVLGDIYELFLGSQLAIDRQSNLFVADKPEVRASGGVFPTPKYIVDSIVDRTLTPRLKGDNDGRIPTTLDMCCGSGVFLLAAYERLLAYYTELYKKDPEAHEGKEIYRLNANKWRLTLHEKQRILLSSVFGVDIDDQAVEVTRFSLLLHLIEDETNESISALLGSHGQRALPKLDENIKCGNSLVDSAHLSKFITHPKQPLLEQINPFDWEREFPAITAKGGFNLIIGNPPYVRIQNMVEYSPEEVHFYQSAQSAYICGKNGNFDKYNLFVERALQLAAPTGGIGFIIPHKFFTIKAGESLRGIISKGKHLEGVVHFGVNQVFGREALTYTCILLLSNAATTDFAVEHVGDLSTWRYGTPGQTQSYPIRDISAAPWSFISPKASVLFNRVKAAQVKPLKEIAEIFVGVQTSADDIFIIKPTKLTQDLVTFSDIKKRVWEIERGIFHPSMLDVQFEAFEKPNPNTLIIFPYQIKDGTATLFPIKEMESEFPRAFAYLKAHKTRLAKRNMPNATSQTWYQYGRSQSLTKFAGEKLIFPILSKEPKYAHDNRNIVVTGGGNGPYYLIRMRDKSDLSLKFIQAVLCHPILEAMVRAIASAFQGGYYSHGKQFIADLPIPNLHLTDKKRKKYYDKVLVLVRDLEQVNDALKKAKIPKAHEVLRRRNQVLRGQLDLATGSFWDITPEEIETAKMVQPYQAD